MNTDLQFVWDEDKNALNLAKHGLDFETAMLVFKDPRLVKIYDAEHSINEDRWIVLGIAGNVVLFVVETDITDNIIRIISARKANKKEKEAYNNANYLS